MMTILLIITKHVPGGIEKFPAQIKSSLVGGLKRASHSFFSKIEPFIMPSETHLNMTEKVFDQCSTQQLRNDWNKLHETLRSPSSPDVSPMTQTSVPLGKVLFAGAKSIGDIWSEIFTGLDSFTRERWLRLFLTSNKGWITGLKPPRDTGAGSEPSSTVKLLVSMLKKTQPKKINEPGQLNV